MQLLFPFTLQYTYQQKFDASQLELFPAEIINIALDNLSLHEQLCLSACSKKLNFGVKQKIFKQREYPVSRFIKVGICAEEVFNGPFRSLRLDIQRKPGMLKSFETNAAITTLNLSRNYIQDDGAKIIANVLKTNATLKNLCLDYNLINDKGIKKIASALSKNLTLTTLSLRYNKINDQGIDYIANSLKENSTLKSLDLTFTYCTDKGAEHLAKSLEINSTLTNLNLSNNFICKNGFNGLTAVIDKKNNFILNVNENYIDALSNRGMEDLAKTHRAYENKFIGKIYKNKTDSRNQNITYLLAERLKLGSVLKNGITKEMPYQRYHMLKIKLDENTICLFNNLMAKEEKGEIFGGYDYSRIHVDHFINVAEALIKRHPESPKILAQLDNMIRKVEEWKKHNKHVFVFGENSLSLDDPI